MNEMNWFCWAAAPPEVQRENCRFFTKIICFYCYFHTDATEPRCGAGYLDLSQSINTKIWPFFSNLNEKNLTFVMI